MKIKILDNSTAEQIAAGEVIENPASVVKELVENSIDAKADKIFVEIKNGGKNYISVTDNGFGISAEQLPLAFKRFATSKLSSFEDLDHLSSLGFRGEALPSIAAVSRVKMTTRQAGEISANWITLAAGDVTGEGVTGSPYGTRVEVSDLFYNTPGRLKFLRADSVESSRISTLLSELSLAHPHIAFSLKSGTRLLLNSKGDGVLLHVLGSLYGKESAETMFEVKSRDSETGFLLSGYISAPHLNRSSRRWITLFVNGRLIKNAMILNALERGYADLLPRQRHPLAVINLTIAPEAIDVNVHPAKIEIRFHKPETVKNLVFRGVKLALQGEHKTPGWPDAGLGNYPQTAEKEGSSLYNQDNRLFNRKSYEQINTNNNMPAVRETAEDRVNRFFNHLDRKDDSESERSRLLGQFLNSYLVVQKGEELLLIDQHAAHERINYNRLQDNKGETNDKGSSIQLTIPLSLELPLAWKSQVDRLIPILNRNGFNLEPLGEDSYAVRSVPFNYRADTGTSQIYDLIENLIDADFKSEEEQLQVIRKTIACHRSVKAKQALSREEMEHLLREWENTPNAHYCPHGRPTVISFNRSQLEKGFDR